MASSILIKCISFSDRSILPIDVIVKGNENGEFHRIPKICRSGTSKLSGGGHYASLADREYSKPHRQAGRNLKRY